LDDVRAFNFFSQKPMPVFANEMTQEVLIREFPYAFADTKYPGVPEIQLNTINDESFTVGDIHIQPFLVWHLKMPVLGFKFGRFTYITDANRIDAAEREKIKNSTIIVVNALRKEKHISHFTLDEATTLVQQLNIPTAYYTHISHQLGRHQIIEDNLPQGIHLAYDGLIITI
jgi:phosphoribosyl 1,2-cyclic phosphate phosphodiesterase